MSTPTAQITGPVDPELERGTQVGEYVVDGKLGEGAFGIVFRGSHPLIGKQVAIKVLARKFSVDPDMVSRFVAEARAVNQIRHRHIIDIFSFGHLDDGRAYYVMEYLDGETLDALLERNGRLALVEALPILRGIARALDAAHAKGIAHRDLKAENVFLASEDGGVFPKLLDFGIAKLMAPDDGLKHKTRTGTPVGTPYYMSPEQCRGRDVDHRTDIYAFGVLAYLMLTGAYPHDADDYMSILMRQLTEEPSAPSTLASDLPDGVDDAIAWFLKKDPADRPASLRTGLAALEAAAEAAGIAVPTSVWEVQVGTASLGKLPSAPPVSAVSSKPDTRPPNTAAASTPSLPVSQLPIAQQVTLPVDGLDRGLEPDLASPRRSRVPLLAIAGVLALAAVAVLLVVRPWEETAPTPTADPAKKPIVVTAVVDAPAPVPEPPRPAPVPLEAQTVIVTVDGVPDGTEVFAGGMTAGAAPGPVQLPRDGAPLVLTFKADGHYPLSKTITPDRDQTLHVRLKRKPRAAPVKRPPGKDDIIDIFKKK